MPTENQKISRRQFTRMTAACSAMALVNLPALTFDTETSDGILTLELQTHALEQQVEFYANTLGLPVKRVDDSCAEVQAGITHIRFTQVPAGSDAPLYHFAFNIPENKLMAARDWLLKRTGTLKNREGREIFHFSNWDAHSFYFADGAGNVAEFIAHHKLKNGTSGPFSEREILRACEIALVVDDVPGTVSLLQDNLGLTTLDAIPPSESFAAVGSRHRMLIIQKRGRQMLTPKFICSPHPVRTRFSGAMERQYSFGEFPYSVTLA